MRVDQLPVLISIHALREEGDADEPQHIEPNGHFYPRPPRGGRPAQHEHEGHRGRFLSTPSARRATLKATDCIRKEDISIHALREEGDQSRPTRLSGCPYFYPRPPRGGRLGYKATVKDLALISIHALREEGDYFFILYSFLLA